MKLTTTLLAGVAAVALSAAAQAVTVQQRTITFDHPITQSQLLNQSHYTIECAQMIGGYCANNPMKPGKALQFLPDPGSKLIRGHLMVMDPTVAGHYVDNVIIVLKKTGDQWKLTQYGLYHQFDLNDLKQIKTKSK